MRISTPYKVHSSEIRLNNNVNVQSGSVSSSNVNVGYYDDTKVWNAIDEIEEQVDGIENSMATKQWVEDKHYLTEHQSLDGYATEEWVDEQGFITEVPSEFVTETELSNCAYVTALTDGQMNELFPIE